MMDGDAITKGTTVENPAERNRCTRRRSFLSVVLGFIVATAVLAPSNSSWAQIAIKGRYWQ